MTSSDIGEHAEHSVADLISLNNENYLMQQHSLSSYIYDIILSYQKVMIQMLGNLKISYRGTGMRRVKDEVILR